MIQFDVWTTDGMSPHQEDSVVLQESRRFAVLGDGFGGSPGIFASKLACEATSEFLELEAGDLDATLPFELRRYLTLMGNVLFNAVAYANRQVMEGFSETPIALRGGASLIAGVLDGPHLSIASVGACRAYHQRSGNVVPVVRGRSLALAMDPSGGLMASAYEIPLVSIGTHQSLEPELIELKLQPGDAAFLCSSGVTEDQINAVCQGRDLTAGGRNATIVRILAP
jgi:serine/threonine protein phosphatase PrpC